MDMRAVSRLAIWSNQSTGRKGEAGGSRGVNDIRRGRDTVKGVIKVVRMKMMLVPMETGRTKS